MYTLIPLYNFHSFHRRLDISRRMAAESASLRIDRDWTRTLNFQVEVINLSDMRPNNTEGIQEPY